MRREDKIKRDRLRGHKPLIKPHAQRKRMIYNTFDSGSRPNQYYAFFRLDGHAVALARGIIRPARTNNGSYVVLDAKALAVLNAIAILEFANVY